MSTNALAIVHDEHSDTPLVGIYKHWDGDPSGFGEDLRTIASKYTVGDGISANAPEHFANGMGCFAAFLVQELKDGPGDVYLTVPNDVQEYVYHLRLDGEHIKVTCESRYGEEEEIGAFNNAADSPQEPVSDESSPEDDPEHKHGAYVAALVPIDNSQIEDFLLSQYLADIGAIDEGNTISAEDAAAELDKE